MANLVGVRFRPSDDVEYFDGAELDLKVGDLVVVETEDGPKEGRIVIAPGQVLFSDLRGPLLPVLHRAASGE